MLVDAQLLILMADTPAVLGSYNCGGFNLNKRHHIAKLVMDCDVLLLQEHWLSTGQLGLLGDIDYNVMYTGESGFDNESVLVLSGRPYGGCAIVWHSNMCVNAVPINVNSMCCIPFT